MKHRAWIEREWESEGMTWVIIARERSEDWCDVGVFLVDAWCLGVKDAYATEMSHRELDEFLPEQIPDEHRATIEPACAKKLIEGAVAYAHGLGLLPFRDFRKARKALSGINASDCAQEFAFGRDGRPCFVVGDDDDEARVRRVLAVLTGRCGADGFDLIDAEEEVDDDEPLSDAEIDDSIDRLFLFIEQGHAPNPELTAFDADGFLAGLAVLPELPLPAEWNAAFWGGEAMIPEFDDDETLGDLTAGAFFALRDDMDALAAGAFVPSLPRPNDDPDYAAQCGQYCAGVLRAIALTPAVARWFKTHPDSSAVRTLERLAALARAGAPIDPEVQAWIDAKDDLATHIGGNIQKLHTLGRELAPRTEPEPEPEP